MENSKNKLRVVAAAGARPNFVKIAPLVKALDAEAGVETLLVHTGQHYDPSLSRLFFDQLNIRPPDINLETGSGSHGKQTGEVLARIEPILQDWKPNVVVVVGDVNSTLACALAAVKLWIPVAHVEAGLRSFDKTMPEEVNRVLTDTISEYLFVSEPSGVENLGREGVPAQKIHLVGNVMIDSLRTFLPVARKSSALQDFGLASVGKGRPFALVTLHRPSNVDTKEELGTLLNTLSEIGKEIPVLFPAHPRTRERIERFGLQNKVRIAEAVGVTSKIGAWKNGVMVTPPVGYIEFLHLMSEAALVLTDSGGVQEETTALGIPCLTMRENTERPITVTEGTNQLVGNDPRKILAAANDILNGNAKKGAAPELWDGKTAVRIVRILSESINPN
ncbi:MAG: UDP-N-acetylglucosamine 2-epimerase (non-hydrolyzing) [Acidobacteria bacterium]|nr:UDP-N-acetylglucosamine 2-epimerase (non-hydrolyzing) [Acidobacteriota bacterium]